MTVILSFTTLSLLFVLVANFNSIEIFVEFTLSLKIKLHFVISNLLNYTIIPRL